MINFIKPVLAVDLSTHYGFGNIGSLGAGFDRLVIPGFAIATTAVAFYFMIGAFKFITSGGNKEGLESARNMITHAIIGFILLIMMFLVLQFLPAAIGLPENQYSIIHR